MTGNGSKFHLEFQTMLIIMEENGAFVIGTLFASNYAVDDNAIHLNPAS